jgi:hypothetical protein
MKPTIERVSQGVLLLMELIPFFPTSIIARSYIAQYIHGFVDTEEHLDWFIGKCIEQFPKFEGLPALRALYCTRFDPADGVPPTVDIPGYSEPELIARHEAAILEENTRREAEFRRQKELAAGEQFKAFPLPEVKRLPKPN